MRHITDKATFYNVYDKDNNLIAHGTSKEIAEKFDVGQDAVTMSARKGTTFQRRYRVEKGDKEDRAEAIERKAVIKKLYEQGVRITQISQQTHMNENAVGKYIHEMKEEGVIK